MATFPLTANLLDGRIVRFADRSQFHQWIASERAAWTWIQEVYNLGHGGHWQQIYDRYALSYSRFNQVEAYLNSGQEDDALSYFDGVSRAPDQLPFTGSEEASLVFAIRDEEGSRAAIGALAYVLQLRFDGADPFQITGVVLASNVFKSVKRTLQSSLRQPTKTVLQELSEKQARLDEQEETRRREHSAWLDEQKNTHRRLLAVARKGRRRFRTSLDDQVTTRLEDFLRRTSEAIDSIQQTEATYNEHMNLQGPVIYWTEKAEAHRSNAGVARLIGLVYAVALAGYVWVDGGWRVLRLVEDAVVKTGRWQVGYVALGAALLILTIVFWVGRLISRTYVSEKHLSIDAEERATMVKTYLALTNAGKVTEAERGLVLAALFRPTSDGLVKDDAAPDISIPGLVSRMAAGR
jgi:hypothetical protein